MRNQLFTTATFKNLALLAICMVFQHTSLTAQTVVENLQNGVEIYNAMREYADGLTNKTLTNEQVADVKARMDKGLVLLEKVLKEGNAEQIRAARYFKNNFKYEYLFVLGMKGENNKAYEISKEIDRDMSGYNSADFPIRYVYFEKNYVVNWDNFAATQAEFFTGMAEICYNLQKNEDAMRYARRAMGHANTTNWLKYITHFKILDIYGKNNTLLTEAEWYDIALGSIKAYHVLTDAERETVKENNYPTDKRGQTILLDAALKNNPLAIAKSGEAARSASPSAPNEKTLQLYEIAYRNNLTSAAGFHETAEAYARKSVAEFPAKATSVGILAVDKMAANTLATDCNALGNIAQKYTDWKQSIKAAEYLKKREKCLENEVKAQKKAAKVAKRANRNFNVYAGTYLFPLLKSNAKRDYGVVLNLVGKNAAWEFSYMKINRNKDNVFDLTIRDVDAEQDDITRWDGYYAHLQPKFRLDKNGYIGLLLGYSEKKFEPLSSNAIHEADGIATYGTFAPVNTQFITMINIGGMALERGVGADVYFGIGATYNEWKLGSDIHTDDYAIENIVLENRKDNYFSFIMRVGMTVGLNFGRGNMK